MVLVRTGAVRDADKYSILQNVNYKRLGIENFISAQALGQQLDTTAPTSLAISCAQLLCRLSGSLLVEAVLTVPVSLLELLLREAVLNYRVSAVQTIIANWPLTCLSWTAVLRPEDHDIFMEDMGLPVWLFKGLVHRSCHCKLLCVDLHGFQLSDMFSRLIVQIWPLLSLKRSQRCAKRLSNIIKKHAGCLGNNLLFTEFIPGVLAELLNHDMMKHKDFSIHLKRGEKLVVKLDQLKFAYDDTFYVDYFICCCLGEITPLTVEVANIIIRSELKVGDDIEETLTPFLIFEWLTTKVKDRKLKGVCLEDLDDRISLWTMTTSNLHRHTSITKLALINCNICLQEGRTRQRTFTRQKFTAFLSCFPHLCRLDLSINSFVGCLGEILDALQMPLQCLSLSECDLNNEDIIYLAKSKHSTSLQELNLSRVCGLFSDDGFSVCTATLLDSLKSFRNVIVLDVSHNQLCDRMSAQICELVDNHLLLLKSFVISANFLLADSVSKILRSCAQINSFCHIHVPQAHNLMNDSHEPSSESRQQFETKLQQVLQQCNRKDDIAVEITVIAYAFLLMPNA